ADANVREINPSDRTNRSVAARIDTSSSTIAIMGTPGTCPILDANNQWEQRRTAQLKCASKPRRKIILRFVSIIAWFDEIRGDAAIKAREYNSLVMPGHFGVGSTLQRVIRPLLRICRSRAS